MDTIFELTLPGARALNCRLPAAVLAADSHQELCWAKKPRTIPLECTTTGMVLRVPKNKIYKNTSLCDMFLKIDLTENPKQCYCIVKHACI